MLTWILCGPHACHHVPVSCTVYQPKHLELECARVSFEEHLFRGLFTQQVWDHTKLYVVMLCVFDTGFHVAQASLKLSALVSSLPLRHWDYRCARAPCFQGFVPVHLVLLRCLSYSCSPGDSNKEGPAVKNQYMEKESGRGKAGRRPV